MDLRKARARCVVWFTADAMLSKAYAMAQFLLPSGEKVARSAG
jgi:hypothetical protein